MKRLGSLLMGIGFLIGSILAVALVAGVSVNGLPVLIAIGLGKLTLLTALGFMGVGAAVRRLGLRKEKRAPAPLPGSVVVKGDPSSE